MNILLTNELGCFSPGIIALAKALSARHRVVIVAPLAPQPNCGHTLTSSRNPLRIKQYFPLSKVKIFSVNGTPCDCVTLAIDKILIKKPDLIITGICPQPARGELIYSSGVVSAAIEGTIQGIPSIAVGATIRNHTSEKAYETVAATFVKTLNYFLKHMPSDTTLNINYPDKFRASKIVCTHMTYDMIDDKYEYEANPFGNIFYWKKTSLVGYSVNALDERGDLYWLKKGYITVTPLKLNLTNFAAIPIVEGSGIKL
jgi:5'-nucleotidase